MVEELPKTIGTANPAKFSTLEQSLDLEPVDLGEKFPPNLNLFIDKKTGERYYRVSSFDAQNQRLLVYVLKGIINVSDVVNVGGEFYSHEPNFNNLESNNDDMLAEIDADNLILANVFVDGDHKYFYPNFGEATQKLNQLPNVVFQHHNILIDRKQNKHNFFDFGASLNYGHYSYPKSYHFEQRVYEDLSSIFVLPGIDDNFPLHSQRIKTFEILRKKVEVLGNFFSDSNRNVFHSMVVKAGIEESKEDFLFDSIQSRLQALSKTLSQIKVKN